MRGKLAHTVWLEKDDVRVAGQEELSPLTVRVTHLYSREEGSWKLIHLHGDAIVDLTEASSHGQARNPTGILQSGG
jgi:hypothetical protein